MVYSLNRPVVLGLYTYMAVASQCCRGSFDLSLVRGGRVQCMVSVKTACKRGTIARARNGRRAGNPQKGHSLQLD